MEFTKKEIFLAAAILCALHAGSVAAQPPAEGPNELIVLLRAGQEHPGPEEVVRAINDRRPVPGGLGEGNPDEARLVIRDRARGRTLEWIRANPDRPLARLQRYIVLRFPNNAPLDGLEQALERNPHVENVERNRVFELSVATTPSDPLLGTEFDAPEDAQWGSHLLRLPEAWSRSRGFAKVGLIDTGIEVGHPEHVAFKQDAEGNTIFAGGNFREHLARDFLFDDTCSVDELDPDDGVIRTSAGHGTHVAGIVAASTDNGEGVAGACWHCSLLLTKAAPARLGSTPEETIEMFLDDAAESLTYLTNTGAQIISMSFGIADFSCEGPAELGAICTALALAERRDILLFAASGNDKAPVEFPASDPRVVAVGGVQHDAALGFTLWAEPECTGDECGSNFGAEQELVAPAKTVLSTVYTGRDHNPRANCGDKVMGSSVDGLGPCSGTSMASPEAAGAAGLTRSINPLLDRELARDVLTSTASNAAHRNNQVGFGIPVADAAVERALGKVAGEVIPNRLTPLFSLFSEGSGTHVYTTSPSAASAFLFERFEPFDNVGPPVPHYGRHPDTSCSVSPCPFSPAGASVYVFTTHVSPFPGAPPLVPLHQLRYDPDITRFCEALPLQANRDFTYTTTAEGIVHFHEKVVDADGVGYEYEGIEGYIFERCEPEPECIPEGAVRLYRLYSPSLDDYAIFPESELPQMQAAGYISQPGLEDWIGYVYPNVDSDGDFLVDGFETLLGTDPTVADSDCDGESDGQEALFYDASDPSPALHGYGDPLAGPCALQIFADSFETGSTGQWSSTVNGN